MEYRFFPFFVMVVTRVTLRIQILPSGQMKNWVSSLMMKTELSANRCAPNSFLKSFILCR